MKFYMKINLPNLFKEQFKIVDYLDPIRIVTRIRKGWQNRW